MDTLRCVGYMDTYGYVSNFHRIVRCPCNLTGVIHTAQGVHVISLRLSTQLKVSM